MHRVKIKQASQAAAMVFAAMGWTWSPRGTDFVPNAKQIEDHIHRLLADMDGEGIESGRVVIRRREGPPPIIDIHLSLTSLYAHE